LFDTLTYRDVIVSNRDENCKYPSERRNTADEGRPRRESPPKLACFAGKNGPPPAPNDVTRIQATLLLLPGHEKEVSQAARNDVLRADPDRDCEEDHPRQTVAEKTDRAQERGGRAAGEKERAVQHAPQFSVLGWPLSGS